MAVIFLSLGTNLGDRDSNLKEAISIIKKRVGSIISLSAFYQTAPWGFESTNEFLNAVVKVNTQLSAIELLLETQSIEIELGRLKKTNGSYSDRIIDIDILYYDQVCINTPNLVIPHPLLHLREFVLAPLLEIAPDWQHPILHKTTTELLAELKNTSNQVHPVEK